MVVLSKNLLLKRRSKTIITSKPQLLNSVVDSLDIRVLRHMLPSNWLLEQLPLWREYHQSSEPGSKPYLVQVPGLGSFRLKPIKSRPYEIVLINPEVADIRIWNPDKWNTAIEGQTGQFYIQFRSKFLQFQGLNAVRSFIKTLVSTFCQPRLEGPIECDLGGWERVSRADLACDVQETRDMTWADLSRFVCSSKKRDTFTDYPPLCEDSKTAKKLLQKWLAKLSPPSDNKGGAIAIKASEAEELRSLLQFCSTYVPEHDQSISRVVSAREPQTVYFGRFASELYARRYNKLLSLPKHNKLYMRDVWLKAGWDGSSPVWRTEFSLSGDFLRCVLNSETGEVEDLRDLDLFIAAIPRIWSYLTHDWLRMCEPTDDSHYWRWPLSESWEVVQSAWPSAEPVKRYRLSPRPNLEQLRAQLCGVALTMSALQSPSDTSLDGVTAVISDLTDYWDDQQFFDKLRERRSLLGVDDFSDTALSALFRAERMLEGNGS